MGAAKNARKARRKAHRSQDRRSYVFDLETVRKLPASGIGDYFLSSSLVTAWDPKEGRNIAVGQSVDLTINQLRDLERAGFSPKRKAQEEEKPIAKPKGIFDFPNWFDKIDANLFKQREYLHDRLNYAGLYQQTPAVTNSATTASIGSGARPYSWEDIDFSDLELRIATQYEIAPREVQKKMAYMKAYGALQEDFDRMFFESTNGRPPPPMITHRMATYRPDPYLRGYRADTILLDDPLKGDDDDQDLPKVGSVSTNRS